ncbi:Hypothetical protein LUCI_3047 [Lucifera butyrica]|uniref:DUF1259 domain-containing protein n=1 Tax=Lucifera butyrica TaxID=1351585 RepID=A0A498RC04_9FIRM|nr:DUF1259 domain-containing protein [Lucifera butyrica]VBB07782.1 Hypothetical protein LUCI_3047 [Lucifera butyrica]
MSTLSDLCSEFANILGGTPKFQNGVCSVAISRKNINVTIEGIPTQIPLGTSFSFQMIPGTNKALNLGDVVLLQEEVPVAIRFLYNQGIMVSALHNHWLLDEPHLMYAHVQSIMNPLHFARAIARVMNPAHPESDNCMEWEEC